VAAVAGTKWPADDSADESDRPPPGQRQQGGGLSELKGRSTEDEGISEDSKVQSRGTTGHDLVLRAGSDAGGSENEHEEDSQRHHEHSEKTLSITTNLLRKRFSNTTNLPRREAKSSLSFSTR